MSELDKVELRNYENEKAELVRANSSGLSERIPFTKFYEHKVDELLKATPAEGKSLGVQSPFAESQKANIESNINRLSGQVAGDASGDTDDEKKKRAETNTVAAVVAKQHQMEIANFAEHGFQSSEQFLDFSEKFKDKNFMATLDALPEEEKQKLADKMANQYNSMSPEERKKVAPEAMNWVSEHSDIKLMSNNKALDGIVADVHRLGGDEAVAQLNAVKAANTWADQVIDREKTTETTQEEFVAKLEQVSAQTELRATVHNAAEERSVANHQAEFGSKKTEARSEVDDMFADQPMIASAAKQLQKAGMEGEAGIAAAKPTEVQIAANVAKDSGMGTPA